MSNTNQPGDTLKDKIIFITGASGFIGSHLTDHLCRRGAQVHGTSRTQRVSNKENVKWWKGSTENLDFTRRTLETIKPDVIIHLAGEVTAANDLKYVLPTYHSLLTSTLNLLAVGTETGCSKIILTGSSTEPLDISPIPNSPYSAAKWATNGYGHLFRNIYKTPVTIVRPFMGYGPGQPIYKLIPHVILSLLKGESPKLSQGLWVTDWVYIEDTVEGILASIAQPSVDRTIDLGSGVLTSVRQIVETVVEIIQPEGKPIFGALPDRHQEHTREADTEYALKLLNWKAKTPLREGLERTVNWYKENFNALVK
jgi:nucleoside-diphosphate-sugar epimerase